MQVKWGIVHVNWILKVQMGPILQAKHNLHKITLEDWFGTEGVYYINLFQLALHSLAYPCGDLESSS